MRSIVVHRPLAQTLALIRDIELLEPLERKARSVAVHADTATSGWYHITGRLAGLVPWTGTFSYVQHDNGWHSADLHEREDGWGISGGFLVSPIDAQSCRITHYEDYRLPARMKALRRPLEAYMRWTQIGEMRDLLRLVEQRIAVPAASGRTADRDLWPVPSSVLPGLAADDPRALLG